MKLLEKIKRIISGIPEDIESVYVDQAGTSSAYGGRRISSFYTPYGIKCIDTNFAARIQNIDQNIKGLYQINRVKKKFIGRDGKEHESMNYETVYDQIPLNKIQQGTLGIRVVWENGAMRDFTNGDNFPTQFIKGKEDPIALKEDIKKNPHLHKVIKKNLLGNLKNYLK